MPGVTSDLPLPILCVSYYLPLEFLWGVVSFSSRVKATGGREVVSFLVAFTPATRCANGLRGCHWRTDKFDNVMRHLHDSGSLRLRKFGIQQFLIAHRAELI